MPEIDDITEFDSVDKKPFFSRIDWTAFWSATIVCFVVYFFTLAPTVTLEDSGELAVAGDWLGVPHPPGYPIWTMTAWIFTKIFAFVKFRGQPNPAWSIGLLSAVLGALSAGITALLICRSGRDILRQSKMISHNMDSKTEDIICWIGGFASSLLFAFTPIMWSQAVIVEVYTLNAFFLVLVMLFTYMWVRRPNNKTLFLAAFLFGLGLTNYQVILLAGIALAICIMLRDFKLLRDFIIAMIPYALVLVLIMHFGKIKPKIPIKDISDMLNVLFTKGALPPIIHPTNVTMYAYLFLNCAWLSVIYFLLPRGRTVAPTIVFAQLGLAFYVYMPIVSDLRNPPMNWGYPRTWEGFLHAITRGQYEKIMPAHIFSLRFVKQIGVYLADLRLNYQLPIALIGFLPFAAWRIHTKKRDYPLMSIAILLAVSATVLDLLMMKFPGIPLYKIPALGVIMIAAVGALAIVVARMNHVVQEHLLSPTSKIMEKITAAIVLAGIIFAGAALVMRDVLNITKPLREATGPLPKGQMSFIIKECGVIAAMAAAILLAITIIYWLLHTKQIRLSVHEESQQWLMSTTVTFIILGIGLIALANIKMDIQDTFIQRVKFISSHMFFAFWIGYGLVFLLSHLDGMFGKSPGLKWPAIIVAAGLPLTPLLVNQYNSELLYVYGGAEQNGHDFGWQFGNYQLRGAEAIIEELSPNEEPLPNPIFPPEMGEGAIFFGGTDPGRFVPTYMIYSADVRPDVYLITQNALADNTYMSVMRDLYGNDIWIPSVSDSAQAFSTYIHDIETGKRPMTAGIKKENGRVQISGVLGVMEINGILAKDIFNYNNYKHEFYVEESYVIRWMYPYLEPHGLIMKINHDRLPRLTPTMVANDIDFWDWYTRRLVTNKKFTRDVVARKSFSKLRSAIAGLYASRGLRKEAETAFLESRKLYPLSPEANFRLAEVYMRSSQFDKATSVITEFGKMDPANTKVAAFTNRIAGIEKTYKSIAALEKKSVGGKFTTDSALQLAELYRQVGQTGRFNGLMQSILNNKNLPPAILFKVALTYDKAKNYKEIDKVLTRCMSEMPSNTPPQAFLDIARLYAKSKNGIGMKNALTMYLKRAPNDWRAWMDLASVEMQLRNQTQASAALGAAIRYGGPQARQEIQKNTLLNNLLRSRTSRTQNLMNMGL
jgi:Flp pilus assembly protein TadD